MEQTYGGLVSMGFFWTYLIGIIVVTAGVCFVICLWWSRSKDKHITRDIIENVNETIVIYDAQDKPCYVNLTLDRSNTDELLQSIDREINHSGIIPEDIRERCLDEEQVNLYEGEIKPYANIDSVFAWKMRPVVRNKKYFGRIFVLNDITQYVKLHKQLDRQNKQLQEALEEQRKFAAITKKLVTEEERDRIMGIVNRIAQDYLEQLNLSIEKMERYAYSNSKRDAAVYEEENNRMIQITRDTISKIRDTVKVLHDKE